ncbi:hypothetical protein [Lewinella cohaerens]|uniref:hypothetical protein n=1 Tax=Lewinella cohaerens TaxID=70995 RepID=UPI00035C6D1E|nr:hypothetical protein [Lewinella cohaerens]
MKLLKFLGHILLFIGLTVATQVGGVVYIGSLLWKRLRPNARWGWAYFPGLYLLVWLAVPFFARLDGRVPLPYRATEEVPLQAQHIFTVLANRHYVKPALKSEVVAVAQSLAKETPGAVVTYLDANFPFFDGFPLLPHRSHDDGEKIDLAFFYKKGEILTSNAPGFLGYGRCAGPLAGEADQPAACANKGYWQYSILPRLAKPFLGKKHVLAEQPTRQLVRAFARRKGIGKLFLEPHLKTRWGLSDYGQIRYHGCAAVRHDDHLHVQL